MFDVNQYVGVQRKVWLVLLLMVVPSLFIGVGGCDSKRKLPPPITGTHSSTKSTLPQRPELPAPRAGDYVGSAACVECHESICRSYGLHPMGQSVLPMELAKDIESTPEGWLQIPGPQKYQVTEVDGQLVHTQCRYTDSDKLLYEQTEKISFCVGSGQNGRAYLVQQGQALYQSPLGWYSGTKSWDLSPGYHSEKHQGFARRIDDSCLYCHAGRVNSEHENRYGNPVFWESAIGCERCHGPAQQHIDFHRELSRQPNQDADAMIDPIVNPADLDVARREDVCNQCHLQSDYVIRRYGRTFNDFRPGDRLDDVLIVLSRAQRGRTRAVSHVEQMRESVCYIESERAMGCISCHDPHRTPAADEKIDFYRDACLKCHESNGCSLSETERSAEPFNNSCFQCHMPSVGTSNVPHTAQTDHRIIRSIEQLSTQDRGINSDKGNSDKGYSGKVPKADLAAFDDAEERVPEWELDRARGIALMSTAWNTGDRQLAIQARRLLLGSELGNEMGYTTVITALAPDVPALTELGASYWIAGPKQLAKPYWEKVLQIDPTNETALGGLALWEMNDGNWEAADTYLQRLLEVSPFDATWRAQRAKVLMQLGKTAEARLEGEKAIEIDPSQLELRDWVSRIGLGLRE